MLRRNAQCVFDTDLRGKASSLVHRYETLFIRALSNETFTGLRELTVQADCAVWFNPRVFQTMLLTQGTASIRIN